ncbi:hypothetical protein MHIR_DE00060 [Candidatus Doolittlea endobia]|uniref:Uncharacterized protein n=1 Tax=Candidatus Doolittlea endobia TaxID=1778262 RepID=A0A143WRR4_9ENTR|nr:hypothetical protein MHIR_DE00060 [Candidatus Doolittlea endobia]
MVIAGKRGYRTYSEQGSRADAGSWFVVKWKRIVTLDNSSARLETQNN